MAAHIANHEPEEEPIAFRFGYTHSKSKKRLQALQQGIQVFVNQRAAGTYTSFNAYKINIRPSAGRATYIV
eukprot:6192098-Pleurochrysis_carterae.AAC.3